MLDAAGRVASAVIRSAVIISGGSKSFSGKLAKGDGRSFEEIAAGRVAAAA